MLPHWRDGLARVPRAAGRRIALAILRCGEVIEHMGKNVLVVSTVDHAEDVLRERLGDDVVS